MLLLSGHGKSYLQPEYNNADLSPYRPGSIPEGDRDTFGRIPLKSHDPRFLRRSAMRPFFQRRLGGYLFRL